MTPLKRAVRNSRRRARGSFYWGPSMPDRFLLLIAEFARRHPRATRAGWAEMAAHLAGQAYRSGYVRGYEWAERDLERRDPAEDPEAAADREGHGWEWRDGSFGPPDHELGETDEVVGAREVVPEDPDPEGIRIGRHVVRANEPSAP